MKWTESAFRIGPSTIPKAGQGLFALQPIEVGDTIGYYTGEIISADELNAGRFSGSDYLLFVTDKHIIVGEGPKAN
ncbi:MAG: SET domain-containing protein-lysine N-methyltransferase, partial [Puniceicoccaceae bacterium]